jgi:hypothetical protein
METRVSQIPFFVVQVPPIGASDRARLQECAQSRRFPLVNAGLIRITEHGPVVWVSPKGLREEDRFLLQEAGFSPQFSTVLDIAQNHAGRFAYVLLDEQPSFDQVLSALSPFSACVNRLPA